MSLKDSKEYKYVKDFSIKQNIDLSKLKIKYIDLSWNSLITDRNIIASCVDGDLIVIDKNNWIKYTNIEQGLYNNLDAKIGSFQKEKILLHEIGHCIFKRDHRNGSLSKELYIPVSLMDANIGACLTMEHYNDRKEYYWNELTQEATKR